MRNKCYIDSQMQYAEFTKWGWLSKYLLIKKCIVNKLSVKCIALTLSEKCQG